MNRKPFMYCDTVDELIACSALPLHAYPTVEFAMRNVELPLNESDYNWITSNEINLFGVDSFSAQGLNRRIARSKNTTGPTFTVDTPIVVTGVCVFAYGEPYSTVVEGNQFFPRSIFNSGGAHNAYIPASPINLRSNQLANLFNGGSLPSGASACPAQLDWGGPTWRFIWAFLNAFRLRFDCPHSAYDTLINERLVDIGNCCSLIDFSGLSDAKTPHNFITRRMNALLQDINMPDSPSTSDGASAVTEPGYFVPINCEQNADGETTPNRMVANDAAYGRPAALPSVETWYRLPFPMPLDTNTKIKLVMDKAEGDEDYEQRMLDEGLMRTCESPIPATASGNFRLDEADQDPDDDGGYGQFTQIPGGMMRLGLGLKGFQIREGVCHQWKRTLADKALMSQLLSGVWSGQSAIDAAQAYSGACGAPAPGEDVADKMIDFALSGRGGIEHVPSDGGPVGE
jgi:hypothetical protein